MAVFKIGKMVMQSLFKKPATLMYPVVQREYGDKIRGQIGIDMDACILCGICAKKCPADAIQVERKEKSWQIERMRCIQCNCCAEVCPKNCLFMEKSKGYTEPDVKLTTYKTIKVEPENPEPAPKAEVKPAVEKPAAAEVVPAAE